MYIIVNLDFVHFNQMTDTDYKALDNPSFLLNVLTNNDTPDRFNIEPTIMMDGVLCQNREYLYLCRVHLK